MNLLIATGLLLSTLTVQELMMNKGIAGNTSSDLLERIESDVLAENPDLVLLMVGTNDMLNSMKMISYPEYSSRLTEIVTSLKKSKIELLLLSPPTVDSAYLFERHDRSLFKESPNQKLDSISRIMEHVSIREEVGFLDINKCFRVLHLPEHNLDSYIQNEKNSGRRDGVHLTAHGNSFLARQVFSYMEGTLILKRGMKIICFGDSLTRGSNVEGSGTISGETYPAYLFGMISDYFAHNE